MLESNFEPVPFYPTQVAFWGGFPFEAQRTFQSHAECFRSEFSKPLMCWKYDRRARSLRDLIDIVELIRERQAGFKSLAEDIDTTTSAGRLIFHVFGSIAEFERERIVDRTKEGLAAVRKRGRVGGRPV